MNTKFETNIALESVLIPYKKNFYTSFTHFYNDDDEMRAVSGLLNNFFRSFTNLIWTSLFFLIPL